MKKCSVPNPDTVIEDRFYRRENPLLKETYRKLLSRFGPQQWWPARTRFEVIVGAILTQNTNWNNVEKAIRNLRRAGVLSFRAFQKISENDLEVLIQPAGYFRVKARRLKNFMRFFEEEYGGKFQKMGKEPLEALRKKLLAINGIGEETADCILLYALDQPSFVVDAYTRRVLTRHGWAADTAKYQDVRNLFMKQLPPDSALFNEYHALIVRLGKEFCRSRALCSGCPLNDGSFVDGKFS